MKQRYDNLAVISLTPEQHENTCNYWYLVQDNWAAHTAFTEKEHLLNWLTERGLTLTENLPEKGIHSVQKINGAYISESHYGNSSTIKFNLINPLLETRTLSNGSYTLAKITESDGIRTVHTLNPNMDRVEYDYFESRSMVG